MKIHQLPILNALAITDNIVVVDFDYGTLNWAYVVLSRVRTLSGLFLLKPLSKDKPLVLGKPNMMEAKEKLKREDDRIRVLNLN